MAMEVECREGYYAVLGVSFYSYDDEIRRAYRKLAMQWHPDKWNATPSLVDMAKHKFQQIQEAYSVLSDRTKRTLYDASLFDEEDEGFSDFVQEMMSLVDDVREEEKIT
ncbi:dnaJ homolog subfamily B member 6-like isoform X1 [Salvia splendens]|uniref:dnaJ homolog subfamily B member 6-like isoform X1 n=1 Tax=Salvia splendens TaxID=180675 RepID=UPI001C25DF30|nr:dnaJ homolog subfamily B member 6-like isoform X1 [Salvia splendens]